MKNFRKNWRGIYKVFSVFSMTVLVLNMSMVGVFFNVGDAKAVQVQLTCADADNDGVCDADDICALGDDNVDVDGDVVPSACDNCPNLSNPSQTDVDGDGLGDGCDNCPTVANAGQANTYGDSRGDACETACVDADADGYGIGDNCLGTDCNDSNSASWRIAQYYYDGDSDGYYGDGLNRFPDGTMAVCCGEGIPEGYTDHTIALDCDDSNATYNVECPVIENCTDQIDNDGEGHVDCDDKACAEDKSCANNNDPVCEKGEPVSSDGAFSSLNIGDTTSEAGFTLTGWSNVWDWGGNYGGGSADDSLRLLMGPGDGCGDGYELASVGFNTGDNYLNEISVNHLDGAVDDSFEVYINNVLAGKYTAGQQAGEVWVTSTFTFPQVNGNVTVKFVATEPDTAWCANWGQVAFSKIDFYGFECEDVAYCNNKVSGKKFLYADGETTDTPLPDWQFVLTAPSGAKLYATSNSDGIYEFTDVCDGTYELSETVKSGWKVASPVSGTYNVVVDGPVDDETGYYFYNEEVPEPVNIKAYKVVCESEIYLPNWGQSVPLPDLITADTAEDFVEATNEKFGREVCKLQEDWKFQWGFGDKTGTDGVDKTNGEYVGEASASFPSTGLCDVPYCGPNTATGLGYSEWKTFGPTNLNGSTQVTINDLENASTLWVREVLQNGYIPYTYPPQGPRENDISAELYCETDILNFDNYDQISDVKEGKIYHCVAFNAPKRVKINVFKVVCEDEKYLPNWGEIDPVDGEPSLITMDTASTYVSIINEEYDRKVCWLQDDWSFQWGFNHKNGSEGVHKLPGNFVGPADGTDTIGDCPSEYCGDNTSTGPNHDQWKTFGTTNASGMLSVVINEEDLVGENGIWVREILKEGYVPYTYPPQGPRENEVSAELYCETDIVNYDNYDVIYSPVWSGTYNCIAFNAPKEQPKPGKITGCKYNDLDNNGVIGDEPTMNNWEISLWTCPWAPPSDSLTDRVMSSVGGCTYVTSTVTENGCYFFDVPGTGWYEVRETMKSGWTQTLNPSSFWLNSAFSSMDGKDFANHQNHEQPNPDLCGDGIVQENLGEECDDTNEINYDACSNDCKKFSSGDNGFKTYTNQGESKETPILVPISQPLSGEDKTIVAGLESNSSLSIKKDVNKSQVNPGEENVEYTITITNKGDIKAFNVVLVDALPEGLSFVGETGRVKTMQIGNIEVGESKVVTILVNVDKDAIASVYTNTAEASADGIGPVSDTADIEVISIAVLAATGFQASELAMILFAVVGLLFGASALKRKYSVN